MRKTHQLIGGGLAVFTMLGPVWGATLVVPTGHPTIQAAVTAAVGGDTVKISPGVYFENVTVPAGKDGLKIIGSGAASTIVDGLPLAPFGSGPGFFIESNNVTVSALTVRHAKGATLSGDGILCQADGCTLRDLRLLSNQDNRVDIEGNDALVANCFFSGNESEGLELDGDAAEIVKNRAQNQDDGGFDLEGDNLLVRENIARVIEDSEGFLITGDNNVIERTLASITDGDGFQISGNDAQVINNRAELGEDDGFDISGDNPQVVGNRAQYQSNDGIRVNCLTNCATLLVQGNTAIGSNNDDEGFDIFVASGTGSGWTVAKNSARDNVQHGFRINGSDGIIRENRALRNGNETEHGFDINGDNNQIVANTATENEADGFRINGTSNLISLNKASKNLLEGIHLNGGDLNTLDGNSVSMNHADGIRNDGTNTTVTNNKAGKNRTDCTSDFTNGATVAVDTGNQCADGSSVSVTQTPGVH